ncbi:MAG: response regulator [Clostridia bacterium]|nr:response regulator [Clostridia bacterium]
MGSGINMFAVYIADAIAIVLSILLILNKSWRTGLNNQEKKYFEILIFFVMFSCVMDVFTFALDGRDMTNFQLFVFYFSNYWSYLANIVIGPLWIVLIITHITGDKVPLRQKIFIAIVCVVGAVILFVNVFTPIIFSVGEDNVYQRGPLFFVFYIAEATFMLDGLGVYFIYRKRNPDLKHFPVFQFIIPFIIGVIIQSLFYGVSTMMVFLVVSICGLIFGLSNENEAEAERVRERQKDLEIIAQQKVQLEQQQEQLEQAAEMAEAASKAKTAFLNNMSHDIRTPMNAIVGYTTLAESHIDNKEQVQDYLGKIEKSSEHLLSLINDVLDMSRIESGKMSISEQDADIKEIVQALGDIVRADINNKEQVFVLDDSEVANGNVMVDKLRLNQILLNIISNSIKYTAKGGTILFKVTEALIPGTDKGRYTFTVKDNGMGMSEEFLKTIFEPFTRVNSTTVSGIQGTGLGMAITKKFIDMMNGTIDIKSKEGEGTETTITFEFSVLENIAEKVEEEIKEFDFKGKKVLLVDDNELNREIATEVLQEEGFIVTQADDGTVAVDIMSKASKDDFDIILMDVQMPIMNGYEATRKIRHIETEVALIPIIAMTANAFEEDRKEALEAGMNDYIPKPVDIEKMKIILSKYIK